MRIESVYALQGMNRPVNNVARNRAEKAAGARDAYVPSSLATDFNVARRAVVAAPDVRTDRINDILSRIDSGEYNVSAGDVATKIVDQIG